MTKTESGRFFEDFRPGEIIRHATPRTVTVGDVALYTALYGNRFAVVSSDEFARSIGYAKAPVDDLITFHVVFGKTVSDISLNALANLGYADGRFGVPVYPGDTLSTVSTILGLKENSNKLTGVVTVRSTGTNQRGEMVVDYIRWVMVKKRDAGSDALCQAVEQLPDKVAGEHFAIPAGLNLGGYDCGLAGSRHLWDDYDVGDRIDHVDGMTIEEAEHQMATRLWQNAAKVHFNAHSEAHSRFGRRLIYGGHIISIARALSFNGLANAFKIVAINGGRHVNPTFAGDTIYAWSEVLEKIALQRRADLGALRLRLVALKDRSAAGFPFKTADGDFESSVVLDFDYTVLMPRRVG